MKRITVTTAQYEQAKAAAPDCLLLFKSGGVCQAVHDDANALANTLHIGVTESITKVGDVITDRYPIAGFPETELDDCVRRLVRAGHRVAICEQVS